MTARTCKRADGRYVVTLTYEDSGSSVERVETKGRHYVFGQT